jgi:four helix bundle protein
MEDFKDLKVWQKAHELTLRIYRVTEGFPKTQVYGLTSQLQRAAVSIGSNIAEGCGRRSDGEMHRFLQIARGSASEVEYQLILAKDLKYLDNEDFQEITRQTIEVQRMLTGLSQSLRKTDPLDARGPRTGKANS